MKSGLAILVAFSLILVAGCSVPGYGGGGNISAAGTVVEIESGGQKYPAYIAAPAGGGKYPGIVLIHSFNGLEPGYKDMVNRFASEGFVVIAPEWQTYARSPDDPVVKEITNDTARYLANRSDVDAEKLGLTGFCAGGRYTMLLLPQIDLFRSGVAWYGFPYRGTNESVPAMMIPNLSDPILIIHGSADSASPVADIYQYATDLDAADKYFELKVYQGEPHGFMVRNGTLSDSFVAQDAYSEMVRFFKRTLT
jgi:carboxymethylenebutenolidase